jgi:hypothetical protein
VALKVIKHGLAGPELLRRFEQESQALARLQHLDLRLVENDPLEVESEAAG